MKVYKATNKDMQCTPAGKMFQYAQGVTYEKPKAELCRHGFHACEAPMDVLTYYAPGDGSRYFEAELEDVSLERSDDSKVCGKKITIGAEIGISGLVKAHVEYVKATCEKANSATVERSANIATGDWSANSATGYGSANSATGYGSANSATVERSANIATGDWSANSATGDWSANSATGYGSANSATGYWSANSATGYGSANSATGYWSANSATGYGSANSATGARSANSATGARSANIATGYGSANSATGERSANSATGERSANSATGARSANSATGYGSANVSTGSSCKNAGGNATINVGWGKGNKCKGDIGAYLVCSEWGDWDGKKYPLIAAKMAIVDGEALKPDTWYTLKDGEFVAVREEEA